MAVVDTISAVIAMTGVGARGVAPGPLILMYHGIGGEDGVPPATFAAQLDVISTRRDVVPLVTAVEALGTPQASGLACLTFDDGYVDFAELAQPELVARKLPATLFVPAGLVGRSNVWDAGMRPVRALLDANGLRGLDPDIVSIGGHGMNHRRLRGLDGAALREETLDARKRLEDLTGRSVSTFAYPYGQIDDFDAAAEDAVKSASYVGACSTHFGRGSGPEERYRLRRVGIEPTDSEEIFLRKVEGAYDWCATKERLGARRRQLLGL